MALQGIAHDRKDRRVHFFHRDLCLRGKIVLYLIDLRFDALLTEIDICFPVHEGRDLATAPAGGAPDILQIGYLFDGVLQGFGHGDHHFADRLKAGIGDDLYFRKGDLREQGSLEPALGKHPAQDDHHQGNGERVFVGNKEVFQDNMFLV